jgi:hypothetical protein
VSVVNVQPIPGEAHVLGDVAGAFVVTLAIAANDTDFKERVTREFENDGFVVIDWGEICSFDLATNDWDSDETRELHECLCAEHPVQYSRFDTYSRTGLNA